MQTVFEFLRICNQAGIQQLLLQIVMSGDKIEQSKRYIKYVIQNAQSSHCND